MLTHKTITINFNKNDIVNILQKYLLTDNGYDKVGCCSLEETIQISKILNLGIPIWSILYFQMERKYKSPIHKDINLNNIKSNVTHALNLPVLGCEEVYMKWFIQNDINVNAESFSGPSLGSPTPRLDYNNATCVDTVNCNSATIVNINDWHSIENHSTEHYGYLISIRFRNPNIISLLLN